MKEYKQLNFTKSCVIPICIVAFATMTLTMLDGIRLELRRANELKSKELDLKIIQLDLACRKHTLDSARFYTYQREH